MALEGDSSDSDNEEMQDTEEKMASDDDDTPEIETATSKSKSDLDWLKGKVTKTKVKKEIFFYIELTVRRFTSEFFLEFLTY